MSKVFSPRELGCLSMFCFVLFPFKKTSRVLEDESLSFSATVDLFKKKSSKVNSVPFLSSFSSPFHISMSFHRF